MLVDKKKRLRKPTLKVLETQSMVAEEDVRKRNEKVTFVNNNIFVQILQKLAATLILHVLPL